jgi:hypothetical protein
MIITQQRHRLQGPTVESILSSRQPPLMSFTMSAPDATEARATSASNVSTEMTAHGKFCRKALNNKHCKIGSVGLRAQLNYRLSSELSSFETMRYFQGSKNETHFPEPLKCQRSLWLLTRLPGGREPFPPQKTRVGRWAVSTALRCPES